jgi:hypothetical protein
MQDQGQTSSREYCEINSNNDYALDKGVRKPMFLWRENSGGFHAEVVVLNHPTRLGFKSNEDFS